LTKQIYIIKETLGGPKACTNIYYIHKNIDGKKVSPKINPPLIIKIKICVLSSCILVISSCTKVSEISSDFTEKTLD